MDPPLVMDEGLTIEETRSFCPEAVHCKKKTVRCARLPVSSSDSRGSLTGKGAKRSPGNLGIRVLHSKRAGKSVHTGFPAERRGHPHAARFKEEIPLAISSKGISSFELR